MTSRSRWFGIIALILIPASASPLGLGDIKLNSYLNERLDAEISVSVSGPEELASLQVSVASHDVFERFGIERADMLSDLRFAVEPRPGGQAIVHVTSPEPVVEPFLTFLVEARSSGGRLLREYTVLLDPPLFVPAPEAAEPAPAAPIQPAPSQGAISRPRAEPAPARPRPAPVSAATTYGPVRRNETLWGIAEQVRPDPALTMNQVMMSLFEANPDAFDGNINRLRAGAKLQVPDFSGMSRLSRAEAAAEVRRHNNEWRQVAKTSLAAAPTQPSARPMAEEPEQRLKLVPPEPEKTAGVGAGSAGPSQPSDQFRTEQEALNEELLAAMKVMRDELRDTQEQIAVRDAEIAELQEQLAKLQEGRAGPAEGGAAAEPPSEQAAAQPATTPAAPPQKVEPAPTPPPATLAEEEGGIFSSLWTWLLIIVVILAGGAFAWRRRQESEPDEGYESWASTSSAAAPAAAAAVATASAADRFESESEELDEFEEEVAPPAPPPAPKPATRPAPKPAAEDDRPDTTGEYAYPFEDTIAGATGINLEQSDPLAEADFHMAYGLYDQAADLIRKAVDREPDRTDLRMKLLDILFVWGKQDEFLEAATELKSRVDGAGSSDWERVAIMGRQICPDSDLFEATGSDGGGAGAAGDKGDDLDFDLGSETTGKGQPDSIDFDVGSTGEVPVVRAGDETPAPDATAELEIEDLGLDLDLPIEETSPAASGSSPAAGEWAEETGMTEVLEPSEGREETGLTEVMETEIPGVREETGLTEVLERVEQAADDQTAVVRAEDLDIADMDAEGETKELPALKAESRPADEDTAEVEALGEEALDLDDLTASFDDDLDKTAEIPIAGMGPDGSTLIEEIFGDDEETKIAPMPGVPVFEDVEQTREMPEVKPSDVTLSEVGTKLDLARAYMDMGDPDGARSILEEVMEEGDTAQKDEARQLLDGLN